MRLLSLDNDGKTKGTSSDHKITVAVLLHEHSAYLFQDFIYELGSVLSQEIGWEERLRK